MLGLAIVVGVLSGMHGQDDPMDAVMKFLVAGCFAERGTATPERDPAVAARLRSVEDRCEAFERRKPRPRGDSEAGMVASARWSYERRLFAIASGDVEAEAARYVAALRPCYEWEGFHECPEREAVFADRYLAERPSSAFAAYLPLLAAHRWLCAAEGYEREARNDSPAERRGAGHTHARVTAVKRLETALASRDPLVRFAAGMLKERGACF